MSEDLAVYEKDRQLVDSKTIQEFLFSSETKLSDRQKNMFMQLAIRNQLDPFKREIHAIPFGNDFNIVTGYQVYIARAEATGKLDGWECVSTKDVKGGLTGARITIYRKDFAHPFVWEVALAEFDKGQSNWKKMPEFMIKKVACGQGFRLAFPNELGGMPYLQEELEGLQPHDAAASKNGSHPPITPPAAKKDAPPTTTAPTIKNPDDPASDKQVAAIQVMLSKYSPNTTDEDKHIYISEFLGREVMSFKDISKGEAGKVITHLSELLQGAQNAA